MCTALGGEPLWTKLTGQTHIRYLISTGKTEWQATERYIGGM